MKKIARAAAGLASAVLATIGIVCVGVRVPGGAIQKAAGAAAGFIMPSENIESLFHDEAEEDDGSASSHRPSSPVSASVVPAPGKAPPKNAQSAASPTSPSVSVPPSNSSAKILELSIGNSGTQVGNFWVKNSTEHHTSLNFTQELQKVPPVKIKRSNASPQVLIYHTHTTESYDCTARTTDKSKSVCAVGDAITEQLQAMGIAVAHDTTYHDYPAYDGSYDRSKVTMQKNMKKYPGIQVTLDIHRDAMHRDDGTCLKTTTVVNGKKAAQMMILAGCDDDGSLAFPNWECNLRLALRLQKALCTSYPGLARPMDFCARKYNEDMTKGSLLIEIGTDANTLEEAVYSGELLGKSLAQVLNGLT